MKTIVNVAGLVKQFTFPVKSNQGFIKNLFQPHKKTVDAVRGISFSVQPGERIAFIGPNGAGKSTTIKILTGILFPTDGTVQVAGLSPQADRQKLAFKIGSVFGQRSQLLFNLPIRDSLLLFGHMYDLSPSVIERRMSELIDLFELDEIGNQPVKKLSLGQRMRAEVALSLLHEPEILFLDEPTIGLDVVAKQKLRDTLLRLNHEKGTTLFLTSHDPGDIEALCDRTVIINHGQIVLDQSTEDMKKKYFTRKRIKLHFSEPVLNVTVENALIDYAEETYCELLVDTSSAALNTVLQSILAHYPVADMTVENPALEEIIRTIYGEQRI